MVFSYHGKPFGRLYLISETGRKGVVKIIQSDIG